MQLTAQPAGGWLFDHWEGDLGGSTNPENVTMNSDLNITAVFVEEACDGDLDGNGTVELADLQILLSNYGTMSGMSCEDGDMNNDGDIDLEDLQALLAVYGTNP